MAVEIRIPQLGMGMAEGKLVEWLVEEGAPVQEGALLFLLESDKSSFEITAPATGVLKNRAAAGTVYPAGELIGTIEEGKPRIRVAAVTR